MDFKEMLETSYRTYRGKWVKQVSGGEVTPEMAEDAIQDACVKAITAAGAGADIPLTQAEFDNWLFTLVMKATADVVNKERRGGMVGRSLTNS